MCLCVCVREREHRGWRESFAGCTNITVKLDDIIHVHVLNKAAQFVRPGSISSLRDGSFCACEELICPAES